VDETEKEEEEDSDEKDEVLKDEDEDVGKDEDVDLNEVMDVDRIEDDDGKEAVLEDDDEYVDVEAREVVEVVKENIEELVEENEDVKVEEGVAGTELGEELGVIVAELEAELDVVVDEPEVKLDELVLLVPSLEKAEPATAELDTDVDIAAKPRSISTARDIKGVRSRSRSSDSERLERVYEDSEGFDSVEPRILRFPERLDASCVYLLKCNDLNASIPFIPAVPLFSS
jgi:hypothetical protein